MPNIKPISSLKNYQSVVEEVCEDSPVYLTKNGSGSCALVDMSYVDSYEKMKAELSLLSELYKGKHSGETEGWFLAEDIEKELGVRT